MRQLTLSGFKTLIACVSRLSLRSNLGLQLANALGIFSN